MSNQCSNPNLLQARLKRNNIQFLRQAQTNMGVPCFYTYVEIVNTSEVICCEIAINVSSGGKVTLKARSEVEKFVPLVI